jgi:hypothetical protein
MRRDMGDRQPVRRLRRVGVWLGIVPALLCAIPGIGLLFRPMFQDLPQQDRPYGWLLDRVAPVAGIGLLVTSAIFAAIAWSIFAHARRGQASGG